MKLFDRPVVTIMQIENIPFDSDELYVLVDKSCHEAYKDGNGKEVIFTLRDIYEVGAELGLIDEFIGKDEVREKACEILPILCEKYCEANGLIFTDAETLKSLEYLKDGFVSTTSKEQSSEKSLPELPKELSEIIKNAVDVFLEKMETGVRWGFDLEDEDIMEDSENNVLNENEPKVFPFVIKYHIAGFSELFNGVWEAKNLIEAIDKAKDDFNSYYGEVKTVNINETFTANESHRYSFAIYNVDVNECDIEATEDDILFFKRTNSEREIVKLWHENLKEYEGCTYCIRDYYNDTIIVDEAYDPNDIDDIEDYFHLESLESLIGKTYVAKHRSGSMPRNAKCFVEKVFIANDGYRIGLNNGHAETEENFYKLYEPLGKRDLRYEIDDAGELFLRECGIRTTDEAMNYLASVALKAEIANPTIACVIFPDDSVRERKAFKFNPNAKICWIGDRRLMTNAAIAITEVY